jgi:heme/copper-type cytochrome/quinol oxidase subunit 2
MIYALIYWFGIIISILLIICGVACVVAYALVKRERTANERPF